MKPLKSIKPLNSIFVRILFPFLAAMVLIHVLIITTIMPMLRPPHMHRPPPPEMHHSAEAGKFPGPPPEGFRGGPRFPPPNPLRTMPFWVITGLQVGLILLLAYAILAWQLRHIKTLSRAITELSQGNLGYRIETKDAGEFGLLSDGVNEMAGAVSSMIRSKEELLLGVSHELRSPLASINVLIEMINDDKKKLQIRGHLNRMDALLGELLESHRLGSTHAPVNFESVNLKEIFDDMATRYGAMAPGLQVEAASVVVDVDRRYFDRLLTNLIENAQKYSKDSGQPVVVKAQVEAEELKIEVSDCGPGIPAKDLPNIFEPFYRVDKSRNRETGGFGLGLYICAKLAALHGGRISVHNRPEGGCTFLVAIPRQQKPVQHEPTSLSA